MSTLPVIALISLTLLIWAIAIWGSIEEEEEEPNKPTEKKEQKPEPEDHSGQGPKAAPP